MQIRIAAHDTTDKNGHAIGYIGADGRKGWFFSWGTAEPPVRAAVVNGWIKGEDKARIIASLEAEVSWDDVPQIGRTTAERALRSYLAKR